MIELIIEMRLLLFSQRGVVEGGVPRHLPKGRVPLVVASLSRVQNISPTSSSSSIGEIIHIYKFII
jgi:hypothetical protein